MMPLLCTLHGKRKPAFSRKFQTGHHGFYFNLVPVPNPSKSAVTAIPPKICRMKAGEVLSKVEKQ